MPYWRLYYHVVWSTRNREPLITPEMYPVVERSLRATGRDEDCTVHAVGIVSDHVHVVISIPPKHAVATVVGRMKGASSHLLNASGAFPPDSLFSWQQEYSVHSFGEKALVDVCDYVNDQEARHAAGQLIRQLEITGSESS